MCDDHWDSAAAYERFMGRWSRLLARHFVTWLDIPHGSSWLDVGCGTGALTAAICELAHPSAVTAIDTSADFLAYCASHLPLPGIVVTQATLDTLPVRTGGYDAVVSSLLLNFLPDSEGSLRRMAGFCSPGGSVAACVWDYSCGMEPLRAFWDAAVAVDPGAAAHDEGVRFPLCRPDRLESAFRAAGLRDVGSAPLTIPTVYPDFEDYWSSFSRGTGPAPSYVAAISEPARGALERRLRETLQPRGAGPVTLQARAWAVSGRTGAA